MQSLVDGARAVVIGASGGIGGAFVQALATNPRIASVDAFARRPIEAPSDLSVGAIDLTDEGTIAAAAERLAGGPPLDLVVVATGVLHDGAALAPEKTWRHLEAPNLLHAYAVNAVGPLLVAKHLLPLLRRDHKTVFAAMSARVGSIEDNRIGGWYAYRGAKAALNQFLRTAAIELARRWPEAVCVGLHPGTVNTALSAPFQSGVGEDKLFDAAFAAERLLEVLDRLGADDTGRLFAWDGERVPF